jgi:hypothetical protein
MGILYLYLQLFLKPHHNY